MPPSPFPTDNTEDASAHQDCPEYFIGEDGYDNGYYDEFSEGQAYEEYFREYDNEDHYEYPHRRFRKGGKKGKGKGKDGKTTSKPKTSPGPDCGDIGATSSGLANQGSRRW